jgi:hypothetical protein
MLALPEFELDGIVPPLVCDIYIVVKEVIKLDVDKAKVEVVVVRVAAALVTVTVAGVKSDVAAIVDIAYTNGP